MKENIICLIVFFILFPRILSAETLPETEALQAYEYPLWKLVAQSSLIIVGVPHAPFDELEEGVQGKATHYITVEVTPQDVLKGKRQKDSFEILYYPEERDYAPSPRLLQEVNGKAALLFLIEVDNEYSKGLYFAGYTPNALQPFDHETVSRIREEVLYQNTVLKRFKKDIKQSELAHYREVKRLIHDLTNREKELNNFKELEKLGQEAVPAIIYCMDDFRTLPIQRITLENPPGFWEAYRHYSPEKVVDALAAILNQITGEGFGVAIANGGSKRERQQVIHGWRIYLYYQMKE